MKDVDDQRPIIDTIWFDRDYRDLFAPARLEVEEVLHPLGVPSDGIAWETETTVAPWAIYVLRAGDG